MRPSKRIAAGIAAATLVIGAGAGLAQAGSGGGRGPGPGGAAVAAYLGLTAAELRTQLESGKSLADVAKAQGKSVSGLEDVIVAEAKSHLDEAVAAGRLTAAQEASMLAELEDHVDEMVTRVGPGPGGRGGHGHGPFEPGVIADYLGLTAAQLRTQLESGKSLADVAKAQGKTVSGLENAIVAAATKKLHAAVAAGKESDDDGCAAGEAGPGLRGAVVTSVGRPGRLLGSIVPISSRTRAR